MVLVQIANMGSSLVLSLDLVQTLV